MRRAKQLKPETFPFLAVLLCAMGSLILMLLVMDRRAKAVARAKAQHATAQAKAIDEETQAAHRAELERRRQALHTALTQQEEDLTKQVRAVQGRIEAAAADARNAEQRSRELAEAVRTGRAQLARSQEDVAEQRRRAEEAAKQTAAQRAKAAALARELETLELTLTELRAARERAQHTYSLVPFRGKRGENRRPLYVECTGQGLVFHPDKSTMPNASESQVRGEVAHRIARQQASTPAGDKNDTTPYLLFLIRPDGIECYYQTLGTLNGLTMDYGYEFIERDWVLDFPDKEDSLGAKPWTQTVKVEEVKLPAVAKAEPRPLDGLAGAPRPVPAGFTFGGTSPSSGAGNANSVSAARDVGDGIPGHGTTGEASGPGGSGAGVGPVVPEATGGMSGSGGPGGGSVRGSASPSGASPSIPSRAVGQEGNSGVATGETRTPARSTAGTGAEDGAPVGKENRSAATAAPARISGIVPVEDAPTGEPAGGVASRPGGLAVRPFYAPASPSPGQATAGAGPGGNPSGTPPGEGGEAGPARAPAGLMMPAGIGGTAENRRPATLRLVGNRDWVISAECKADAVVLYPGNVTIPLASLAAGQEGGNRLVRAVQQMIARKQATVRAGEPPYRPQVRFLVRPDGLRSFYAGYPWLEGQQIPMSRQNIDKDEEIK